MDKTDHSEIHVAVVIPCRNEKDYIKKCVESVINSNYPKHLLDVLVVDGLSDDGTIDIVTTISESYPNVKLLNNEKQTTPFALNIGLKYTKADVKIILGAHAEVDPNFIAENVKVLNDHPDVGCAGGIIENVYETDRARQIGLAMSSVFGVGNAHFRTGTKDGYVDTVAFGAYREEVFEKIGYFDEDLTRNQDDEFNFRLLKNGFKIYLSNSIISRYYVRASYEKLFKQYYQYGYWKVYVNKKHSTVTTVRQLIPMLFVLYLVFGLLFSLLVPTFFVLYVFGILVYFGGAFYFAFKVSESKDILNVVYSFLILHLSYGLGYIKGMIDFMILNKKPTSNASTLTR